MYNIQGGMSGFQMHSQLGHGLLSGFTPNPTQKGLKVSTRKQALHDQIKTVTSSEKLLLSGWPNNLEWVTSKYLPL